MQGVQYSKLLLQQETVHTLKKYVTAVVCSSFMIMEKLPMTLKRVIHRDPVTIFPLRMRK